ncbi:MAG: hypothetical protein M3Y81_18070 [Chloroflexota bacterium]|nr:hypothetical protein [Chloroflexota bacterium]
MNAYLRRVFHPASLFAFVILVAILASITNLGTDGITYAVAGAAVTLLGGLAIMTFGVRKFNDMLNGKPSMIDHMAAPGGYRRARQTETEAEAARLSSVRPTPNRPLYPDEDENTVEAVPGRNMIPATPTHLEHYDGSKGGERRLNLAQRCNPPIAQVLGRAVLFLGMRGSGKTNALARFLEQVFRFPIPALICDYEEGFLSFPFLAILERSLIAGSPKWEGQHHYPRYWKVTAANAEVFGYSILEYGVQAVLQIHTYESLEEAATIMTAAIKGMFRWAEEQPPNTRVPALICLDEAQHFLPQDSSVSNINQEQARALLRAFMNVNARGRKRGLTPIIATQRPAQIRKEVIAGSEIYFLMKQTNARDLDAYEELLGKPNVNRRMVASFQAGEALVYEGGEAARIRFYERESEHTGHTPGLDQALERYEQHGNIISSSTLTLPELDDDQAEDNETDTDELEDKNVMPTLDDLRTFSPPARDRAPAVPQRSIEDIMLEKGLVGYHEQGVKSLADLQAYLKGPQLTSWQIRDRIWPRFRRAVAEIEQAALQNEMAESEQE